MDRDTVWAHTHRTRAELADLLRGLDDAAWEVESLCAGWTVRDVAAHVPASALTGFPQLPGLMARGRFNFDRAIFRDAKRRAEAPLADIIAVYDQVAGSRKHVPVTTHVEPLVDSLVHTQDIARPLGIEVAAPVEACAYAADRTRLVSPLLGSWGRIRRYRMVATDTDWVRGGGETVEAPMLELLMLCAGRPARNLTGAGGRSLG